MSWWKLALLITLVYCIGTMGAGYFHLEYMSQTTLTTEQVAALWRFYIFGFAIGSVATWLVCLYFRKHIEAPLD